MPVKGDAEQTCAEHRGCWSLKCLPGGQTSDSGLLISYCHFLGMPNPEELWQLLAKRPLDRGIQLLSSDSQHSKPQLKIAFLRSD